MPGSTREALREQLKRGEISPVYTLFGEETYLRDTAARYIADRCFAEGELRDFNEAEFSLNSPENLQTALAAADQLPMMAARRLIRIVDVRVATTSNRDTLKEEFEEAITAYLENPSGSSVVIFVADELSSNRKLGKLLKERTTAVDFARLQDHELRKWAADRFRDLNATIRPETVNQLVGLTDNDLRRLTNEINKLAAASLPEGTVTNELVTSLVPHTRELSNFGLTDNLVAGRKQEALRTLKKILDDGTDPLAMLGLISSNYRRLLIARELMDRGSPRNEIVSASKAPYGAGQDAFLAAARRVETVKLAKALGRIAETDFAIKTSVGGSGSIGARVQLEMLVCELALL